jgi:oxygen-independent coproporphyrinogen-3 oxidase
MNYWNRRLYYGFGASAVSFDGIRRYKNHTSVEKYINAIQKDETYIEESEILTKEQEIIEYIMLALRTTNGLNLEWLANKYGIDLLSIDNNKLLLILNDKKLIKLMNGRLSITPEGFLLYNSIVGDIISAIN